MDVGRMTLSDDKNKDKIQSIRPGVTGWWAYNERNYRNYNYQMKMNSLGLDSKIIFKTISVVIKSHGAV